MILLIALWSHTKDFQGINWHSCYTGFVLGVLLFRRRYIETTTYTVVQTKTTIPATTPYKDQMNVLRPHWPSICPGLQSPAFPIRLPITAKKMLIAIAASHTRSSFGGRLAIWSPSGVLTTIAPGTSPVKLVLVVLSPLVPEQSATRRYAVCSPSHAPQSWRDVGVWSGVISAIESRYGANVERGEWQERR